MEAGSKRTAKANSIAKHNTAKSIPNKNAALTLRGKSAKYFKMKLGDTIFNAAMQDYVDVLLKIFFEDTLPKNANGKVDRQALKGIYFLQSV